MDGAYVVPTKQYKLSLSDPKGRCLLEEPVALSSFGSMHREFAIPTTAVLGSYLIQITSEDGAHLFQTNFEVAQWQVSKIQLSLSLPQKIYFRGETIEGAFQAMYYYGTPVVGATIRYEFNGETREGKLDEQGKFAFSIPTTHLSSGQQYTIAGSLDAENISVQENIYLAKEGFSIAVQSQREVILSGETTELKIETKDVFSKPLGTKLALAVYRIVQSKPNLLLASLPWQQTSTQPATELKVAEYEIQTDAQTGIAKFPLSLIQGGNYIIRITGYDRHQNPIEGRATVFVSDDQDQTKLRIFANKQSLKVGETVPVTLHSRLPKGLALLTYESDLILGYQLVNLVEGPNSWNIQVDHKHFPNFMMNIAMMSGQQLYDAKQSFTVARNLKVQIQSDHESYAPGAKAEVTLITKDHLDQPVSAELSLGLVDQAFLSLYPDKRENILQFFEAQAKRNLDMRSSSSCNFSYNAQIKQVDEQLLREIEKMEAPEGAASAIEIYAESPKPIAPSKARRAGKAKLRDGRVSTWGPSEESLDALAEEEISEDEGPAESQDIRKEIAALGYWNPCIVTDGNGIAKIPITMPTHLTQWRFSAVGCTPETLVGETTLSTTTSKEFFVELKLPNWLQEQDSMRILARVHNLSNIEGAATIIVEITSDQGFQQVLPLHVQAKAKSTQEFVLNAFEVPAHQKCRIQAHAKLANMEDKVQYDLSIRPWGMEYVESASGMSKSSKTVFLQLPSAEKYTKQKLTIVLGASVNQTLLDIATGSPSIWFDRCIPYHTWPTQASNLLATSAVLQYLSNVKSTTSEYRLFQEKAKVLVASIVSGQHRDGGWILDCTDVKSHIIVTARMLLALAFVQEQGITVPDNTKQNAIQYLQNVFSKIEMDDLETKALVQYALALAKEGNFASANRLYRERHSMKSAGLAYTILLLCALDKPEMAQEVAQLLVQKYKEQAASWITENASWTAHPAEIKALVALSLIKALPQSSLIEELITQLWGLPYSSFIPLHGRGTIVSALAESLLWHQQGQNDYTLQIFVNQHLIQTLRVDPSTTNISTLEILANQLVSGRNRIEFQFDGQGSYAYAAILQGFTNKLQDPNSDKYPKLSPRQYLHTALDYKGKAILAKSSSPIKHLELGQRTHVKLNFQLSTYQKSSQYIVIEEPIPVGTKLVQGSITGDMASYDIDKDSILFYLPANLEDGKIEYQLVGFVPGTYRVLPTTFRHIHTLKALRQGQPYQLTVLGPQEKSPDPYKINAAEQYELGQLYFGAQDYDKALEYLLPLNQSDPSYASKEISRILLWIYTEAKYYDAQKIVYYFEILKEKYPELYIPFDRVLVVGRAYEDLKEYERGYLVFQAIVEASFEEESKVGGVLEDQGQFIGSLEYMHQLWLDYPDSAMIAQAYFGLSQALYAKLEKRDALQNTWRLHQKERIKKPPTRKEILSQTIELLRTFLALYPENTQTPQASFSLASAYLALDQFKDVVQISQQSQKLYTTHTLKSSFQYMEALGYFSLYEYSSAIQAAETVANGTSKDKEFATYILGQIYHSQNNPASAIQCYRKIQDKFPDAKESIAYFERRYLNIPEVTKFLPGAKVELELQYANVQEVQLLIYRVDLMRLYLQQKSLSGITKVQLAGIAPVAEKSYALGDGKDYKDCKKQIELPLSDEGAYLLICRGDDLFASGLILITSLDMMIQESSNGIVRVNVINLKDQSRPQGVHVKVVGSESQTFVSGETDLRGIFVAEQIKGQVTVIACEQKNRYAFYRGQTYLGEPPQARDKYRMQQQMQSYDEQMEAPSPAATAPARKYDFRSNLQEFNEDMQQESMKALHQQMRSENEGVQIEKAK